VRYPEWTVDPDPTDTTYVTDFPILLRDERGETRVMHDRHTCGLFARVQWLRLLHKVGFDPRVVLDESGRDLFVAKRGA